MEQLVVGIIGLGTMGHIHARNLATLPTVRLLAVASRREHVGQATATSLGIPRLYTDYEALLADDDVEAVVIAAASSEHANEEGRAALTIALAATESFRARQPIEVG